MRIYCPDNDCERAMYWSGTTNRLLLSFIQAPQRLRSGSESLSTNVSAVINRAAGRRKSSHIGGSISITLYAESTVLHIVLLE